MADLFDRLGSFLRELKRRKVYRVAAVYAAVAFVVWQVAEIAVQALLPGWMLTLVVVLSVVAFPVVVALAWAFDLTPEGMERTEGITDASSPPDAPLRGRWVLGLFAAGVGTGVLVWAAFVVYEGTATNDRAPEISSIAVLPLENLAPDADAEEWFTAGMHEAIIAELGKIRALRVPSRTSAMRYRGTDERMPEIARELDVDALIEGSVLQAGDEVRVTLRLVHGPTDRQMWSKNYVRELRDVLALQSEVARTIAEEIRVALTPEEQTRLSVEQSVEPEAYRQYLMGNFHSGRRLGAGYRQGIEHYQNAIAIDSTFAPAYAGLALAYIEMNWWLSLPPETLDSRAREATLHALERDSTLAEAHIALGRIKQFFEWDWTGAEAAFRRGITLNPSATHARLLYHNYLFALGRFEEAEALSREAIESDPLSAGAYNALARTLDHLGRHAEAQDQHRTAVQLTPAHGGRRLALAESYAMDGRFEEALSHAARADSLIGDSELPIDLFRLAYVYARAGHRTEALRILNQLRTRGETEYVPPTAQALIHLGLDDKEEALELLEEAHEQSDLLLVFLKGYYMFDPLRDEPRFQALLRQMDFPES